MHLLLTQQYPQILFMRIENFEKLIIYTYL